VSGVLLNIIDAGPAGEDDEKTSNQSDDDADLSEVHCESSLKIVPQHHNSTGRFYLHDCRSCIRRTSAHSSAHSAETWCICLCRRVCATAAS
jgi:hypothetical protein